MKIILNRLGRRLFGQWYGLPGCRVCGQPEGDGPPPDLKNGQYGWCSRCGNDVSHRERTLSYKIKWGRAYRRWLLRKPR